MFYKLFLIIKLFSKELCVIKSIDLDCANNYLFILRYNVKLNNSIQFNAPPEAQHSSFKLFGLTLNRFMTENENLLCFELVKWKCRIQNRPRLYIKVLTNFSLFCSVLKHFAYLSRVHIRSKMLSKLWIQLAIPLNTTEVFL